MIVGVNVYVNDKVDDDVNRVFLAVGREGRLCAVALHGGTVRRVNRRLAWVFACLGALLTSGCPGPVDCLETSTCPIIRDGSTDDVAGDTSLDGSALVDGSSNPDAESGSITGDVRGSEDGPSDASPDADASLDGVADSDSDAACASNQKSCGAQCVLIDDPAYGCGESTCVPCAGADAGSLACSTSGKCAIACGTGSKNCGGQCVPADESHGCEDPAQCTPCGAAETCHGSPTSQCTCVDEALTTTCAGKACGTATNNCGHEVNCPNTCTGTDSCGGGSAGLNSCGCTPLSNQKVCGGKCVRKDDPTYGCGDSTCDASGCPSSGGTLICSGTSCVVGTCGAATKNCGNVCVPTDVNNGCGDPDRCTPCAGNETCVGSPESHCQCVAESTDVTCAGKACGPATNNCGQTVNCPDRCASPNTCGGGGASPNACGCTPDNAAACLGKGCGPATNNCSEGITCPDTCVFPDTCGGGAGGPNACGCTPQSNEAVCAGKGCGSVNNCGNIVNCPNTCAYYEACGSGALAEGGAAGPNDCGCPSGSTITNGVCCPNGGTVTNGRCIVGLGGGDKPDRMVVDQSNLYWVVIQAGNGGPGSVNQMSLSDGLVQTLVSLGDPTALAVEGTNIYFAMASAGTLNKVPIGGGQLTQLASGQEPTHVAVDAANLYWTNPQDYAGTIMKMSLAGGTPTTLADSQHNPWGIAVDATNVYWVNGGSGGAGSGSVMKAPVGGGSPTVLASTGGSELALDSANVYWGDNSGAVMQVALSGGNPITLASAGVWRITVDATSVYWTDASANGSVMKVPIGGGTPTTIVSGGFPSAIAVDATSVYWASADGIRKATPK